MPSTWFVHKAFTPAIEVQLCTERGERVDASSVLLRAYVTDLNGTPILHTTSGGQLVGGGEAVLERGVAVFDSLRILEVSSKHAQRFFKLVVECKQAAPNVKAAVSEQLRVLSKNMDRKGKRDAEDGTR